MTTAEKIKNELSSGSDVKTISKKLRVSPNYVYSIRSIMNNPKKPVVINTPVGIQVTIDPKKGIVTLPLETFSTFIEYIKNQAA